ncbi:MAG TPA: hypothetical protein VH853_10580 [Polyangia bacterium]|jgi:hypothetical protein|nr:hypothetical protein [Polyangia bacterium]
MKRLGRRFDFGAGLLCLSAIVAGCKPDLGAPQSLITGPTILAIRGVPPEAAENAMVSYDALTVDTHGTIDSPQIGWAQCLIPDPPANVNDVSTGCLAIPDDAGPSPTFTAAIPMSACTLFGPETPPPVKGQPPTRPADPDTTGGYYQPVRATWQSDAGPELAFALERVTCRLANAPVEVAADYAANYLPNDNPTVADVVLDPAGIDTPLFTAAAAGQAATGQAGSVAAGEVVTLQTDFSPDSAETFLVWNVVTLTLDMQRESLRLSWYATAGAFEHDVTGRGQTEAETFTQNVWTAPTTPGPVFFWMVLRDDRGGVDFAPVEIDVTP